MTTRLQADADVRAAELRRSIARDLRRLRDDAGLTRAAIGAVAGVDPSLVTKVERGIVLPSLETYARICASLGADLHARVYPAAGPPIHDRHQVAMADLLLASIEPTRWSANPEVPVRRPSRGWVDLVLHDRRARLLVASELESDLRRIEQLLRWSREKAESLPSAATWPAWAADGDPVISRLLVVRWTRANRAVAADARRLLREAYRVDARDALDALTGAVVAWPGPALVWARLDGAERRLVEG